MAALNERYIYWKREDNNVFLMFTYRQRPEGMSMVEKHDSMVVEPTEDDGEKYEEPDNIQVRKFSTLDTWQKKEHSLSLK